MNSRIILSAALMALAGAAQAQSPVVEWTSPRLDGGTGLNGWSCCRPEKTNVMATDAAGNAYIVGYRPLGPAMVWSVSKVDASGALVWQASNAGPERRFDYAYAVAVDAHGDPVVTGRSSQGGWSNMLTIKYSGADGSLLWEQRFRGPEGGSGSAVAIDPAGDVIVIGTQRGRYIGDDYATVKYRGSDGAQLWASGYGRVSNESDTPNAVAVDRSGNVFVTGSSGRDQFSNFATIKYDGATGAQQWVALYAPQVWGSSVAHFALDLAVDSRGDPVVTGKSDGARNNDFATVKYDGATGAQRWAARFDSGPSGAIYYGDEAKAVAIDGNDDVYVTGGTAGVRGYNWRMATVKYSGVDGSEVWRAISQLPWSTKDSAYALVVDAAGVQVAGWATDAAGKYYPTAIAYSPVTGAQLWTATFDQASSDNTSVSALKPAGDGAYYLGIDHYYTREAHFIKRYHVAP
ncbi:PQQ-binding-like beta-propeller repeat protein [Lysobacter enzymogenes]|uniref:outer membrane protein assembly factor BamB family protein n=1 Tax=Lysobacter enzymogenes TaxID=69 RepID=UPI00089479A1|nr:PQQ-binding-like beta-propeller repeat protein [Lysobacter enzymogenes]SDX06139.1 Beta-propeller repeat-containing protein [Lysobacter enzymogenes]